MTKDYFSIGEKIDEPNIKKDKSYAWIDEHISSSFESSRKIISDNFDSKKIKSIFIVITVIIALVLGRIFYLQILKGGEYLASAEENRIRLSDIKAPRGNIYDRKLNVLAQNIPNFSINVIPADLSKEPEIRKEIISKISTILNQDADLLIEKMDSFPEYSYQKYQIVERIPYDQATQLIIDSSEWRGVSLDVSYSREYLDSANFSHLLGYMGKPTESDLNENKQYSYDDIIGKMGIESRYDEELRGKNGKKEIEVDSFGKEKRIVNIQDPKVGDSLILNIDAGLQKVLSEELIAITDKSKIITGAAAVALVPDTGQVLALVSAPGFDNNAITRGLTETEYNNLANDNKNPIFNRSISGEYPSGSTIKPVIAAAALAEGIINEKTTINSTGGIRVGEWFFPDWKADGHGMTDVKKALSESVNTFFYTIGGGFENFEGLGIDRLTQYLNLFGLGQTLGIDLDSEADGFLPSKQWKESNKNESWYIGDTYHLSIGQGDILVTPLQVASYTATIANGGILYQPYLVKAFSSPEGTVIRENTPITIRNNFINQKYLDIVKDGMKQAVTSGSAVALNSLPVSAGAKTGTAQFGANNDTHAWFTAFAPFENPEIVITVIIEAGGEGHSAALPVAKKAMEYWFNQNNAN